jgi:hypothetical protein
VPSYTVGYRPLPAQPDASGEEIPLAGASAVVQVSLNPATGDGWGGASARPSRSRQPSHVRTLCPQSDSNRHCADFKSAASANWAMGAIVAEHATARCVPSNRPTFGDPACSSAAPTKLRQVEPPHSYLREPSASVVHHADYLDARDDHALCGAALLNLTALPQRDTTDAVCPDCETRLVVYHLQWWRETAQAATTELEKLRAMYRELQERAGTLHPASAPTQVDEGGNEEDEQDLVVHADAPPATLIDQARRELTELCQQFDGAVPYRRLKNTMQAFSDRLDTHQRVLLAEEIGTDGSLIRWATHKVEALGWQVANSPIQENSEMMWQEWLQESHQEPKKAKRRFGRTS